VTGAQLLHERDVVTPRHLCKRLLHDCMIEPSHGECPVEPFQRSDPHKSVGRADGLLPKCQDTLANTNQLVTNPADLIDFLEAVWYDLARCK
jgi:hypothetical protein